MAEPNGEFGQAVKDALEWLGATPETGGALLGINARTLGAMCQGIVPMRSLIIRFADEMRRHCERQSGAPDWWKDVDSWLTVAGYAPRRDGANGEGMPGERRGPSERHPAPERPAPQRPAEPTRVAAAPAFRPVPAHAAASPRAMQAAPAVDALDEEPAREFYHPVYERMTRGDRVVHIFRILDREDQPAYQITMGAEVDYKARAAQVKQDLADLSKSQFERKYGRFRVEQS